MFTDGSKARYLVREQLARRNLPGDAVGTTDGVVGFVVFDSSGAVDQGRFSITVDLASLRSDSRLRDRYIRNNTLETSRFPDAEFQVREAPGLPWPFPASGEADFELIGDMSVHGVTRLLTWEVTAEFDGDRIRGQARTSFTFATFDMNVPRVFLVLSVEDNIRLELDFEAVISTGG